MTWDGTKKDYDGAPTTADEILSAEDWNDMVTDQKGHASRHETDGSDEISNVPAAHKWVTARKFTIAGGASGEVTFDGSADVTVTVTITTVDGGSS